MDAKAVVFYTNDLASTPSQDMLDEAVLCVRGLVAIQRWVEGVSTLRRSTFLVPVAIAAYNKYMGGVDRVDQRICTNAIQRKETRVPKTMFGLVMDLALVSAYAIMTQRNESYRKSFRDF